MTTSPGGGAATAQSDTAEPIADTTHDLETTPPPAWEGALSELGEVESRAPATLSEELDLTVAILRDAGVVWLATALTVLPSLLRATRDLFSGHYFRAVVRAALAGVRGWFTKRGSTSVPFKLDTQPVPDPDNTNQP